MNKSLLAASLCAALAGCQMIPEYFRPAAPIPSAWQDKADGARKVAATRWQNYFPDPRLQALIEASLENNRDLRIATARISEARALYGIQRADRLPNVALAASRNASLTPAGASAFSPNALHSQRYDVGISLVSFELDFWGRVASLNEAAKASYLSSAAAQRAFRLSLIAEVANAYLSLIEMQERTQLAAETARTRGLYRDLIQRRRDAGVSGELDLLQAEASFQAASAERANLYRQQAAASNLLDLLVGRKIAAGLPDGLSLAAQGISNDLAAGLPAEVLLQRPDVQSAEQRLIAANANIGAARAAFFPRVTLTGGLGTASRTLNGLFSAGSGAWNFQPTISLPLFDAGRLSSNMELAEARKVIAIAEYEKSIQQAFREVADLLNARVALAEQLTAQQANVDAQTQRLKLVEARYDAGISSHLEVLDAQRDCFAAQQGALQVQRTLWQAATQLYKALAGQESSEVGQ